MNQIKMIELLSKMPLLKDCDLKTIEKIATNSYLKKYDKNDVVLTPDTATYKMVIIANAGRMKIYANNNGDECILYLLSFGDFFNMIHLLDKKKDHLYAAALDYLEVLHCDIDIILNCITTSDNFNKNLLRYLSERLRDAQTFNLEKTFYTIEIRLVKLIYKNIVSDDNELNLINDLSHEEIAKILGTSRAVVNRNLQKLKKEKMIDIKRKKILIQDYAKMKQFLEQYNID